MCFFTALLRLKGKISISLHVEGGFGENMCDSMLLWPKKYELLFGLSVFF